MNCDHTLSKVLKCAAILLIVAVTANANILKGPRNNLRLGALFSLKVQGVPRVQILFEGDILQTSLVPQKVTCMCRVQWETIITTEGSVEFRPPEDWVSRGRLCLFHLHYIACAWNLLSLMPCIYCCRDIKF